MHDTKSRQRCPCGKKLRVALISLETDALDILTNGVNTANRQTGRPDTRPCMLWEPRSVPDRSVYTFIKPRNYTFFFSLPDLQKNSLLLGRSAFFLQAFCPKLGSNSSFSAGYSVKTCTRAACKPRHHRESI